MFFEKIFSATRAKGTFTLLSPVLFYSTFDRITSGEVPIEGILIVAIKLSISVFFLDYSLSFLSRQKVSPPIFAQPGWQWAQ